MIGVILGKKIVLSFMIWVSIAYYLLRYDPKEVIKVYVGVNDQDISEPEILEKTKHDVIEVIKHENWTGSPYDYSFPDLALIKLAKRVMFKEDHVHGKFSIVPLCLSNENVKEVVYDSEAFVAGKYMNYSVLLKKAILISPIFMQEI